MNDNYTDGNSMEDVGDLVRIQKCVSKNRIWTDGAREGKEQDTKQQIYCL